MNSVLKKFTVRLATIGIVGTMLVPSFVLAEITDSELWGEGDGNTTNAGGIVSDSLGQSNQSIVLTIAKIIRSSLGLLGIVVVVIVIIGGFEWMAAGGAEDKVSDAKKRILQAVIGMIIILSAFAIAQFIIGSLSKAVTPTF